MLSSQLPPEWAVILRGKIRSRGVEKAFIRYVFISFQSEHLQLPHSLQNIRPSDPLCIFILHLLNICIVILMLLAYKGHLKLTEITAEPTKSSRVEGLFLNVGLLGNSRHNT